LGKDFNESTSPALGKGDRPGSTPPPDFVPYDTSSLSFGLSGDGPLAVRTIRMVEWMTGKITLLRIARDFDRKGRQFETTFWAKIVELLRVRVNVSPEAVARIPKTGPVVVVANHPYGFVDGLVMADLVSRVRPDLKILTRAFFATLPEIDDNMVPVAFAHDEDSVNRNIEVRREVMAHLAEGGVVILFPAGRVATAPKFLARAVEHPWNPFTSKMILRSEAVVVPIYFPGQNGFFYQTVQLFSPTLRQSLMMHEIWRKIGKSVDLKIGEPIGRDVLDEWKLKPGEFMKMLRERTLQLRDRQDL